MTVQYTWPINEIYLLVFPKLNGEVGKDYLYAFEMHVNLMPDSISYAALIMSYAKIDNCHLCSHLYLLGNMTLMNYMMNTLSNYSAILIWGEGVSLETKITHCYSFFPISTYFCFFILWLLQWRIAVGGVIGFIDVDR